MRVLGIVGSVRKNGNTEILIREALDGAKEAGAETEIVLLAGKNIIACDGCGACRKVGVCPVKDDMQGIYKQMEAADAILLGSPVYFHSFSTQIKAVMDRTNLFLFDKKLNRKVGAPIVAVGRGGGESTRTQLISFFVIHGMIPLRGVIGFGFEPGGVRYGEGRSPGSTALGEAQAAGREVVDMVRLLKNG